MPRLGPHVSTCPLCPCPARPADREDGPFIDGGIKCRIGLDLWRQQRYGGQLSAAAPAVVHLIGRSSPFSGNDSTDGLGEPPAAGCALLLACSSLHTDASMHQNLPDALLPRC